VLAALHDCSWAAALKLFLLLPALSRAACAALQVRPEYIVPLVEELHGKKWPKFNSEKICHIAYGRIQASLSMLHASCASCAGNCLHAATEMRLAIWRACKYRTPRAHPSRACWRRALSLQGKTALVQHFQNSSLLHEDKRCRPILFHTNGSLAGEVEQFPGTLATPSIGTGGGGIPPGGVPLMAAAALQPAAAMGQQPLSHLAGPEQGGPEAQ
jgi:hypothetical protein